MRGLRFCAPMITLILLTACGGSSAEMSCDELALSMRTHYLSLTSFSAAAEITADYGERVYQYEANLSGDGVEGQMDITAPENIAGLAVLWRDGSGGMEYDGVELTTGPLSPDGLSPADAMPLILEACCRGAMQDSCMETVEETQLLRVGLANPDLPLDAGSRVDVWVNPEDFSMAKAEVSSQGRTVVRMTFSRFSAELTSEEMTEGSRQTT